jgi:hypothetical protein
MKIIIDRSEEESQRPVVTIDTKTCHYPYAIREAIELALELDGYSRETIREVFGATPEMCCKSEDVEM